MLLMASIHLDSIRAGAVSLLTSHLKLEVMRQVRCKISEMTPEATTRTVGAMAVLANSALVRAASPYCSDRWQITSTISLFPTDVTLITN